MNIKSMAFSSASSRANAPAAIARAPPGNGTMPMEDDEATDV